MRKIFAVMLSLLMVFSLSACAEGKNAAGQETTIGSGASGAADGGETGASETVALEAAELFDKGYWIDMSQWSDTEIRMLFKNEEESYIILTMKVTEKQMEEFEAIDGMADDYNELVREFISGVSDTVLEDISDEVPSQEELDAYVGLTVAELEAMGFSEWGYGFYEDYAEMTFDNNTIEITCEIDNPNKIESPDSVSAEERGALVISAVRFNRISTSYFSR